MNRNLVVTDHHIDTAWREACATSLASAPGDRDAALASPAFSAGFRCGASGTLLARGLCAFSAENSTPDGRAEYRAGHTAGVAWRKARVEP